MRLLKQYGAKRSGTCYTHNLVGSNFRHTRVLTNGLGWKHGMPVDPVEWCAEHPEAKLAADDVAEVCYIVSVKDPYAWLTSICRFQHEGKYDKAQELVASLNGRYAAWRALPRSRVVRYENLLADLQGELGALGEQFGLQRRHAEFINDPRVIQPGERVLQSRRRRGVRAGFVAWPGEDTSPGVLFQRKDWYLERRYMAALTDEAREAVTAGIDWDLFGRMGYEPCRS